MYPDLSYIFHDLLGTPADNWLSIFKTFGLFLVLAILTAAWLLRKELRRRAEIGQFVPERVRMQVGQPMSPLEYAYNALFGFIVGYKFVYAFANVEALQADAAAVLLTLEGSWLGGILGALLLLVYYWWQDRENRQGEVQEKIVDMYPADRIGAITIIAAISGVVGSKIFALIEDLPSFLADPVGTFLSGSGLAIYGGLIGGFVGVAIYLRYHKIPLLPVMDAVAPGLIVAYGIGRLGCHLSGDGDWGIPAAAQPAGWFLPDWLWAYDYPRNVIQEGVRMADCSMQYCSHLVPAVYPTSVYETTAALLIGTLLWKLRKPWTHMAGLLFSLYMVLNGIERFLIEKIRVNERYEVFGNFTQAELIAIGFVLGGLLLGGIVWSRRQPR